MLSIFLGAFAGFILGAVFTKYRENIWGNAASGLFIGAALGFFTALLVSSATIEKTATTQPVSNIQRVDGKYMTFTGSNGLTRVVPTDYLIIAKGSADLYTETKATCARGWSLGVFCQAPPPVLTVSPQTKGFGGG